MGVGRARETGKRRWAASTALAVAVIASIAGAAPVAADDAARLRYEASLGRPPRQLSLPAHLGHTWSGTGEGVAGGARVDRGELVVDDAPFDDTGADTIPDTDAVGLQPAYRGLCQNTSAFRHGEATYPESPAHLKNAADLVQVRVADDGRRTTVLFVLQTLVDRTVPVVTMRLQGATGSDHVVEIRNGIGSLNGKPAPASVDTKANTLEVQVPTSELPAGPWRLAFTAGIVSGGNVTVFDTVGVPDAPAGSFDCWQDRAQAAALASGQIARVAVDPARLRARASDPPSKRTGSFVRLHVPSFAAGEGRVANTTYGQTTADVYRGSVQPYATTVPVGHDPARAAPVVVLLHCLSCNHRTYQIATPSGLQALADGLGAVVVTPLAYGEGGHYRGEAHADVFDVLADVRARYAVDGDRLYLGGMSMGSLGTFRLALLHPDLWAAAFGVGVYTSEYCVTPSQRIGCATSPFNYFTVLDNGRNLPWGIVNGALDELTPVTGANEIVDRLAEVGAEHRFWSLPTRRHETELAGDTADLLVPFLRDRRRTSRPARVTYVVEPAMRDPAAGHAPDDAWWVRDVTVAAGSPRGSVDASSTRGAGFTMAPLAQATGTGRAGPFVLRGATRRDASGRPDNHVSLTLRGVTSVSVDVTAAGLAVGETLSVDLDADRPVTVAVPAFGRTLRGVSGRSRFLLQPEVAAPHAPTSAGRPSGGRQLPSTGGPDATGVVLAAATAVGLALTSARLRRRSRSVRATVGADGVTAVPRQR